MGRNIAINLYPLPILYFRKELQLKGVANFVVSRPRSSGVCAKVFSTPCTRRRISLQSLDSCCHVGISYRNFSGSVSFLSDRFYCPLRLTGYWIGPDSDDGWGFVEAFVIKIL